MHNLLAVLLRNSSIETIEVAANADVACQTDLLDKHFFITWKTLYPTNQLFHPCYQGLGAWNWMQYSLKSEKRIM